MTRQDPPPPTLDAAVRTAILTTIVDHTLSITAYETSLLVHAVTVAVRHHDPTAPTPRPAPATPRQVQASRKTLGPIPHGTTAGYTREAYRGLPHCEPCRAAYSRARAERRASPAQSTTGRTAATTLAELFAEHTTADSDHFIWTGPTQIRWLGDRLTGAQVSWRLNHVRPADGVIRRTRTCGRPGCVAVDHLEDRRDRQLNEAVLGPDRGR